MTEGLRQEANIEKTVFIAICSCVCFENSESSKFEFGEKLTSYYSDSIVSSDNQIDQEKAKSLPRCLEYYYWSPESISGFKKMFAQTLQFRLSTGLVFCILQKYFKNG